MKYLPLEAARSVGYQQQVKEANIKRIFDLVRGGKCKSRAELVRVMKLSATSVSVLVEELAAKGLIDEVGPQQTYQPGRRPISLRFNGDSRQLAAFALSRRGVRYTLLNLNCEVLESLFVPFDSGELGEEAGDAYARVFQDILEKRAQRYDPRRAVLTGVTFPGIYIESEQSLCMKDTMGTAISVEAMRRFQQRVGTPMYFVNGTMAMAYAEKKRMDAKKPDAPDAQDMLFVQINDGIGGAIISEGSLYTGPYNAAGEIGHFTIDYQGLPCPCGNVGCLERYASLNAILGSARQACREAGLAEPQSIEDLAANHLDEAPVIDALNRAADLLAHGLYSALCFGGMRSIVLGGGVEALGEGFLRRLYRSILSRSLLIRHLDLSYAQAGPDAESVGLGRYFLDKLFTITM